MTTNRILLIADASELNRATFAEIFARDYEIMEVAEITELFHAIHKHIENIAAVILGGMPAVEQSVECLQQYPCAMSLLLQGPAQVLSKRLRKLFKILNINLVFKNIIYMFIQISL